MNTAFTRLKNLKFFRQRGAALLFVTLTIAVGAAAFTIKAINQANLQIEREKVTNQSLALAKAALIGWSVSHSSLPGSMPFPDRNGDGNYDGESDCYATNVAFSYSFLLGQLPISDSQDNNCLLASRKGLNIDAQDGYGNRLWYAVSRNLVRNYNGVPSDPIINPGIIATPTYNWLTVYDKNGQLVSDRVAAVIIAPGPPTASQDRSAATPAATQYLDSFTLAAGGGAKSNRTYVFQNEDFFMGEDARNISGTDAVYVHPYEFNDKLIYITIDELMAEIEKRAAAEAKSALNAYKTTNGFFPFAAALGSNTNPYQCVNRNLQGLLPTSTATGYTCSCTNAKVCTCSFGAVSSVSYTRSSGSWGIANTAGAPTGACSVGGTGNNKCTCTGMGTCKNTSGSAVRFSCDACGVCTVYNNTAGSFLFTTAATFSARTGGCSVSGSNISCNGTAVGTFTVTTCTDPPIPLSPANNGLPSWFITNNWQDYLYYAVSSNCTSSGVNCTTATPQLTIGTGINARSGIRSLIVAAGSPIITAPFASSKGAAQAVRPSCDVKDYLDSTVNTSGAFVNGSSHLTYDTTNLPKSSSYNDRTFIVAP